MNSTKIRKNISLALRILSTALVGIIVAMALLIVGGKVLGLNTYMVLSGSMEPKYMTGGLIYVKPTDPEDLEVGDPLTFYMNSTTVATHRIVGIFDDPDNPGSFFFRTQGDANDYVDAKPVYPDAVIGKPVFHIPYLGFLAAMIQDPSGFYLIIAVVAAVMILTLLPDLIYDEKKEKKRLAEAAATADDTPAEPTPTVDSPETESILNENINTERKDQNDSDIKGGTENQ